MRRGGPSRVESGGRLAWAGVCLVPGWMHLMSRGEEEEARGGGDLSKKVCTATGRGGGGPVVTVTSPRGRGEKKGLNTKWQKKA